MLSQLGKGAQWAFARYMRTPLASTGLLALVTMSAMAGSNALYMQTSMHPSPFFGVERGVPQPVMTSPVVAPVPAPITQREQAAEAAPVDVAPVTSAETTGSVASVPAAVPNEPVGNSEVFAVQKKLSELGLFEGKVDGYYGPMTARAIRTFEERNGLVPMGALSANVVAAILNSDASGRMSMAPAPVAPPAPQPQVAAALEPAPIVAPVQQVAVAPVQPQPAVVEQPAVQQDRVVAQLPPLGPVERAVDTVGTAAANSIDSIIAAVGGTRDTPDPVANPPIPTASLPTQPMPSPVASTPAPTVQLASMSSEPVATPTTHPTQPRAARPASDATLVADIQRGLASLGFFHGAIDGNPGPETSRAIREFESFNRYKMTGQVQPDLIELLRKAGAAI